MAVVYTVDRVARVYITIKHAYTLYTPTSILSIIAIKTMNCFISNNIINKLFPLTIWMYFLSERLQWKNTKELFKAVYNKLQKIIELEHCIKIFIIYTWTEKQKTTNIYYNNIIYNHNTLHRNIIKTKDILITIKSLF